MLKSFSLILMLAWLPVSAGFARTRLAVQQNTNSISGHVSDDRRMSISDLRVELLNEVDSVIQTTKTNGSGLYVFRRLSGGVFQVRVQPSGRDYISQTKRIDLARARGFGAMFEQVDFVLARKGTASNTATRGVLFVQEVPEQARKEFERGSALLQKANQRTEAMGALKKAIEIFPQYFDALELLGTEYVKNEEYEPAIPPLTKALEVNNGAYPSLYALAVAQYHLKQLPEALSLLRRAVALNQRSVNANFWLGMVLRQSGKLGEAETYLKRADALAESKLADPHWQLALLYNQLKRSREAADQLELFLKAQPDTRDAELIKRLIQRLRQQAVADANKQSRP